MISTISYATDRGLLRIELNLTDALNVASQRAYLDGQVIDGPQAEAILSDHFTAVTEDGAGCGVAGPDADAAVTVRRAGYGRWGAFHRGRELFSFRL